MKTRIEQLLLEGKSTSEVADIVPCMISYVNQVKRNLGIVNGTERMVHHHIHYKEIDGYDEVVLITHSEHNRLHRRLRKTGKCNVPVDELKRIARAAHNRTDTFKENKRKPECIKYRHDYVHKNIWQETDYTYMMPYITLTETIGYSIATNHIWVSSGFYGSHYKKLFFIDII